jgi:hypothetical protein
MTAVVASAGGAGVAAAFGVSFFPFLFIFFIFNFLIF